MMREGMESTMSITVMVIFILIGASVFTLVFQGVDGGLWIEHLFTRIGADDPTTFLIVVNILIFLLAFFLDFFEIAFIVIPLLAPMADKLGIDLIWFGVLICVNMQTSFMHPPFGFALFYLRGIAPKSVASKDIYLGAIPWVGLQLLLVGILIFFPELVTGLLDKPQNVDLQSIEIKLDDTNGASGSENSENPFSENNKKGAESAPLDDPADYFKKK
jgi:TRAP-type mannitol/chloroaromatic compound transport system permease large subunit